MFAIRLAVSAFVMTAVTWVPGTAIASASSDVMATVNTAVASFNKGDGKTWLTLCTSSASIISNIPPYQYHSCADWWNSHAASDKKNEISGEKVTLGKAWDLTITGDRAYGSFPANFVYKQKGKAMSTSGVLTIALQKTSGGWLMTGWSWSAHS
jgi:hypothetical protein